MKTTLLVLLLLALAPVQAQQNYAEIARLRAMNQSVRGIRSMADGEHYTTLEQNNIIRYRYDSPQQGQNLTPEGLNLAITDYLFSPNEQRILIASTRKPIYRHSYTTNYSLIEGKEAKPILTQADAPRDASFTPNGQKIVYSDNNDLYIYDIATQKNVRITDDGEWNSIINGTTDWVYEEEFGFTKAYAISPDSRRIAYLRFDEREVPTMEMMRYDGKLYNQAFSFKYPKAGERNSIVEVWSYDIVSGQKTKIDCGKQTDQYIPRVDFTPDGKLYFYRLNRRQNTFEVVMCDTNGAQRIIYEERSQQYVDRVNDNTIKFIDKDRFVVCQESNTGFMHLYLYTVRGGFQGPITRGKWEVTQLVASTDKRVWYLSTEGSSLRRNLYSIGLDGRNKKRITTEQGFYAIEPSRGMKYYISTFSNSQTPNRIEIFTGEGALVRTLVSSEELRRELASKPRSVKEFFSLPTTRGDSLNAYIIKPRDFDATKQYPVLMTQYSGPGSQSVQDRWSIDWEDALVENGYIVVCVDSRGTGFRGEQFKKQTYGRLGAIETEDQIAAARYLGQQAWVDAARIGIYGWSYGGFMALNCAFKGHGLFKMAIAVAPVSSWRYYDTIYTEIYNNLPQLNATGYDDNSPINFARMFDDKSCRLLIIHGTADDNVHLQNTIEMSRALNRAGKQYDMMIYPDQNHSMQPNDGHNVRQKMIDYTLKNL